MSCSEGAKNCLIGECVDGSKFCIVHDVSIPGPPKKRIAEQTTLSSF